MHRLSLILAGALAVSAVHAAESKPNVVLIYGDDVGYGDVGAYGAEMIPTPNIDQLADEGTRFTDGHCSAATCTPSRFSMLTGRHGFRHGVRILAPNAPMAIQPEMLTLPQVFKQAGYQTAVIGKWHLGLGDGKTPVDWNGDVKPGPLEIGFDYSFLLPSTNDRVPCVYLENYRVVNLDPKDPLFVGSKPNGVEATEYPDGRKNPEAMTYYKSSHGHNNSVINGIGRIGFQWGGKSALWNDETMSDVFVEKTREYLAKAKEKDQPFFLYFASQDIHVPRAPHPRFKGMSQLGYRGDAMVQFDWSVGEIMKALDEQGLAENTIVIFSSDNGPVYDDGYHDGTTVLTSSQESDRGHDGSGPFRGGKYQIYEGGTRVPTIVRWPGNVKAGEVSDAMVNQIDLLASFAGMLDVKVPATQAIDSRDMSGAWFANADKGAEVMLEEAAIVAIRQGKWKFIPAYANRAAELYDLDADPGEQKNLAGEQPQKVEELTALLKKLKSDGRGVRAVLGAAVK
ncbi:arylsulfatase [Sulfuriroseicoccus oceanibius]|uniref:Arylsulfatase n=2 Tax=Sulfuriroseicoccus oceanibius TaxID=2707525 RepID=A0A7T7F481_9BACT|nr:arylsulfatase [Sulfuriroseicoccus oceanibius]